MKSFDELTEMGEDELSAYLRAETERLIDAAAPTNKLRMRAISARCAMIRRTHKNPYVACMLITGMMLDKAQEMGAMCERL